MSNTPLAAGTGASITLEACQVCGHGSLTDILFIGYLPPVNQMYTIGSRPHEQPAYPAQLVGCEACHLVQLACVVDKEVLFPPEYPYRSGTTRILREDFLDLHTEATARFEISKSDLIVDIGSNDGTLLSSWHDGGYRVRGIEPTDMGKLANERGIPTEIAYFGREIVEDVVAEHGHAKIVTATNVFAHIEDIDTIMQSVLELMADTGVFITESHYLKSLIEGLQYDTIYHEHLRYYSLTSLRNLLARYGLDVVYAREIPTHGGSIRVYAARQGVHPQDNAVRSLLAGEQEAGILDAALGSFGGRVVESKLRLHELIGPLKRAGSRIYGIGAPSRASTLINYTGLDVGIIDAVMEIPGSYKIGKYMPGTLIPVLDEGKLYEDPPEFAMLFSWHIADELIPKLREKGFEGGFIVPLPEPVIVR